MIADAQGDGDPRDGTASVVADYIWDGKSPIELSKGQFIYFNFAFHDPSLANAIWGLTDYLLVTEYRDQKGDIHLERAWFPVTIATPGSNPHEIYLAHELGIDVMSYYTDFYYPINDSSAGFMDVVASN